MPDVAVLSMPERFAESVSEHTKQRARVEMLQDAMLEVVGDLRGICDENPLDCGRYPARLAEAVERLQDVADEMMQAAGDPSNLLSLRAAAGISWQELAAKLGVPGGVVVHWEGGAPIPDEFKARLCEMFGVSQEWLTGAVGEDR
jgi:DNA-binding transcriptional regulator YiaG